MVLAFHFLCFSRILMNLTMHFQSSVIVRKPMPINEHLMMGLIVDEALGNLESSALFKVAFQLAAQCATHTISYMIICSTRLLSHLLSMLWFVSICGNEKFWL
jgi:hypothetical protein